MVDSEICFGRLTFKNTRVPVDTVFACLEQGCSVDEALRHWPQIPREAMLEALRLAGEALHEKHRPEIECAVTESKRGWDACLDKVERAASILHPKPPAPGSVERLDEGVSDT